MEIRSLINKTLTDINEFGKDKKIYYVRLGCPNPDTVASYVFHYFLEEDKPDESTYNKYFLELQEDTLGNFYDTKIFEARLLQLSGLQHKIKFEDFINNGLMATYKQNYDDYVKEKEANEKNFGEKYWKIKERFTYNPEVYEDILKILTSDNGIMINEIESCKQDIDLLGPDHEVIALVKDDDGKLIYEDWILINQVNSVNKYFDNKTTEDKYVEHLTLSELLLIFEKQNDGVYEQSRHGNNILKFPKVN